MRRPIDVIFLGPYPPPVNGQSVAFKFAHDQYNGTKKLCDQNLEQLPFYKKIFFALKLIFTYIFLSTSRKYSVLHFVFSFYRQPHCFAYPCCIFQSLYKFIAILFKATFYFSLSQGRSFYCFA